MAPPKRTRQQEATHSRKDLSEEPPAKKKLKTGHSPQVDASPLDCWTWTPHPPQFWDGLSKVWLTRGALEEFDRRTRPPTRQLPTTLVPNTAKRNVHRGDLLRFARRGGPDLSGLRGFPRAADPPPVPVVMSQTEFSHYIDGGNRVKNPVSSRPATVLTRTTKTTPYSLNFAQHLVDHRVKPLCTSVVPNLDEIISTLDRSRKSLSPSQFSDAAFVAFQNNSMLAKDKTDVMADVLPAILGPSHDSHPLARNAAFGNLEALTDGTITPVKPDIYYGALSQQLIKSVRDEIGHHIMPSTTHDRPLAPNFFVEIEDPDGSAAVAMRQANYDGAVGARAMQSLHNYRRDPSEYDGHAHTFTSIYHDGSLKLYAHRVTAPADVGGRPMYHMTQLRAYAMTNDRTSFAEGASAFRNARDFAKQKRDLFIRIANSRASQRANAAAQDGLSLTEQSNADESADEFVDCEEPSSPRTSNEPSPGTTDLDGYSRSAVLRQLGCISTTSTCNLTPDFAVNSAKKQRPHQGPDS
ncbi:hypothetical protein E4U21_000505 [Claviceps maximensis]|nr:hypothetical protein E4U21_000505 [Claviceps maximensis]